jgi:hypothetical protein
MGIFPLLSVEIYTLANGGSIYCFNGQPEGYAGPHSGRFSNSITF